MKIRELFESVHAIGPVYHGTSGSFTNFSDATLGTSTGDPNSVLGHFFTSSKREALLYGKNVITAQLYIKNPYEASMDELVSLEKEDYIQLREDLVNDGYDGIIAQDDDSGEYWYVAFSNNQIKILPN
jgi:hypothetical protein